MVFEIDVIYIHFTLHPKEIFNKYALFIYKFKPRYYIRKFAYSLITTNRHKFEKKKQPFLAAMNKRWFGMYYILHWKKKWHSKWTHLYIIDVGMWNKILMWKEKKWITNKRKATKRHRLCKGITAEISSKNVRQP